MSSLSSLVNTTLGRYYILEKIGSGGMATVFKAEDTALKRMVAVKVLHEHLLQEGNLRERFEQEAQIIASFSHPNIVQIYDFSVTQHQGSPLYYMVMPLITGNSLADLIAEYRQKEQLLPLDTIRRILLDITSALGYAHDRGMVHRDIKPSNILFDQDNRAILTDFGIARMVQQRGNLTQEGTIIGTPAYMPPEQALGDPIDNRSDLYALGVIFFELVTGRTPFEDTGTASILLKHLQTPPPRITDIIGKENSAFDPIAERALAKIPADRYQSAQEFANDIRAVFKEETTPSLQGRLSANFSAGQAQTMVLPPLAISPRNTIIQTIEAIVIQPAKQNPIGFIALAIAIVTLLIVARLLQERPSAITVINPTTVPDIVSQSMTSGSSMVGEDFFFTSTFDSDDMTLAWWQMSEGGSIRRSVSDGDYLITNTVRDSASATLFNPEYTYKDVGIQLEATLSADSENSSGYGIIFRYQDPENYNVFAVDGRGRYSLWVRENGEWKELRNQNEAWTTNPAINPISETNVLRLNVYRRIIQGFVNDVKVVEAVETTFEQGGIGVYLATPSQGNAQLRVSTYATMPPDPVTRSMTDDGS